MSQKELVFNAIVSVVGEIEDNTVHLTKDQRKQVADIMVQHTVNGDITIGGKNKSYDITTEEGMKNVKEYWPGTINNWLRKDTRLNGGEPHQIKNPGSRSQNKQIKSTRAFIKQCQDILATDADNEEVQAKLEKAQAVLEKLMAEEAAKKAEKAGKSFNADDLPEELRDLVSA